MMMSHMPMEEMEVLRRFVSVADRTWDLVQAWPPLAQSTVGKQLIRAADSVGANLIEGDGRLTDPDALHFFFIARGSGRETGYWLHRAATRNLLAPEVAEDLLDALRSATQLLNRLISYRRASKNQNLVREEEADYSLNNSDATDLNA